MDYPIAFIYCINLFDKKIDCTYMANYKTENNEKISYTALIPNHLSILS